MEIKYLGHASFFIKFATRAGITKVVTDPYESSIGIKFPKTEADIVTVSHGHKDHNFIKGISGEPLIIDMPGEFEKKGVRILGYQSFHDKKKGDERGLDNLYKIEAEGMSVLHCGDLGVVPDDSFIDQIGEVDVLIVPTGGFYTIDGAEAVSLVNKIEPSIVIPMHYNHEKLDQKTFGQVQPVAEFLKKMGVENITPVPKLIIKKETLEEEMKIVVMEISN